MTLLVQRIDRYRSRLRDEMPTVTRRSLEWLLVNAAREWAGLEHCEDTEADPSHGPELMWIASRAVAEAVRAQGAQFGSFQLYVANQDVLMLLVTRNFPASFANLFGFLHPDGRTACSRALACGQRVVIRDVANDELFAPHAPAALTAGIHAIQSTPLKTEQGRTVAILSTHFGSSRSFSNDELHDMDTHAGKVSRQLAHAWA